MTSDMKHHGTASDASGVTAVSQDGASHKSFDVEHENEIERQKTQKQDLDVPLGEKVQTIEEKSAVPELDRTPSQAAKMGNKKIVVVILALCMALFLAALDMTIVSTALPTIATDFNASEGGYSWIASSYLLANAACIPLWGKISDIWGRKYIILLANVVFLVGSLICALAKNMAMILAGRAVQGSGGGGIVILANISVSDLFSLRDRPMYYGIFGAVWAVAGALGPIIGGAFTTDATWRWCFWINLPIGGVSLVILTFFLHIESPKTPFLEGLRSIDWTGTFLIVGGTLMFLFGLEFGGSSYPWASATVICLIIFGVVTWVIAMLVEWKFAKYPVIPPRLFDSWYNKLILLICYCHGFVFISGTYYLPLYFQTVLLASPIMSGVYVLPLVIALSVGSAATGVIIKKTGRYRELIIVGMAVLTLGWGLFIDLKPYASWPRIIIYQLIAGAGIGPNFQSPLVAFQANIRPADMATATAIFGFVRQLSMSMSVVLGTVIYQNVMSQQSATLTAAIGPKLTAEISSSFAGSSKSLIQGLTHSQRTVVLDAFTKSLDRMWIFYTCMAAVGFIFSLFIRPRELTTTHTVQKTGLAEQERARQERLDSERKTEGTPNLDV
ncbi:Major facilitator superfamily domain general substrate transporter [Penicillium taxi]|uniref:Major facilitator superfamily domain general substrate transporter n=1 Tax=Penicillium taxi TaxID=168475 RepID=UPI0025453606|nr:Major facilitator superfamily domain general substrate transporter [Penicillium taxi]KAJ5884917.1 Major facilitator superfamily domain general substrate transporter [Penicillium taxi]